MPSQPRPVFHSSPMQSSSQHHLSISTIDLTTTSLELLTGQQASFSFEFSEFTPTRNEYVLDLVMPAENCLDKQVQCHHPDQLTDSAASNVNCGGAEQVMNQLAQPAAAAHSQSSVDTGEI